MTLQVAFKSLLPWLLLLAWVFQLKKNRDLPSATASLYVVVFAGFSANFTLFYREMGQVFSALCALIPLSQIISRKTIPRYSIPLLAFLFLILFSLIGNTSPSALGATVNFISVSLTAIAISGFLLGDKAMKAFKEAIIYSALILSIAGIAESIATGARAEATFTNPNYLAFFLGVASCIILFGEGIRKRGLIFFVLCAGILATQSRAGAFFPVAALGIYAFKIGMKSIFAILPLMAAVALAFLFNAGSPASQRDLDGSDAERYLAIEAGIQMTRENPIKGIGWGRYIEEFWEANSRASSLFPATSSVDVSSHRDMVSHNDFVRVFAELGVLGGIFFILLLTWSFFSVSLLHQEYRNTFLAALLGTSFFSLTHNNLNSSLFWIVVIFPIAATGARLFSGKFTPVKMPR